MMYTFGDVRTPLPVSAQLIEQIVRKQLVDIVQPLPLPLSLLRSACPPSR